MLSRGCDQTARRAVPVTEALEQRRAPSTASSDTAVSAYPRFVPGRTLLETVTGPARRVGRQFPCTSPSTLLMHRVTGILRLAPYFKFFFNFQNPLPGP